MADPQPTIAPLVMPALWWLVQGLLAILGVIVGYLLKRLDARLTLHEQAAAVSFSRLARVEEALSARAERLGAIEDRLNRIDDKLDRLIEHQGPRGLRA